MAWNVPIHIIGGNGGGDFELNGAGKGGILKRIWVWVGGWGIRGVHVELSNGESRMFGQEERGAFEFTFNTGELIQSLSLWGNGAGTRLGAIKFRTNQGREFFAKMRDWPLKTEYKIRVGSGICVGVKGKCGADIDNMAFIFVKDLQSCCLENVRYPTLESSRPQVRIMTNQAQEYANRTCLMAEYRFIFEKKLVHKRSWSQTTGFQAAVSYQLKAGVPELLEQQFGANLTVSHSATRQREETEETTERWELPVKIQPHKLVGANLKIGLADISLPYSATMIATTTDGNVLRYNVNGVYEGVSYTRARIEVVDLGPA